MAGTVSADFACVSCPSGSSCSSAGLTQASLQAASGLCVTAKQSLLIILHWCFCEGWWHQNASLVFSRCLRPSHCIDGQCSDHREGVLCALCSGLNFDLCGPFIFFALDGYYGEECSACASDASVIAAAFFVTLLFLCG